MDDFNIHYIAGFFDGEGSVGVYRNGLGSYCLRTQLTQTKGRESYEILSYLLKKYGGNLGEQISLSGRIKYNWQINGDLAARFLKDIRPCLLLKRRQAEIAIKWQRERPGLKRDWRGRIVTTRIRPIDKKTSDLLKQLKKV